MIGLMMVVRVLEKMVKVTKMPLSSIIKLLDRSIKTIISGTYPTKVVINIRRNVMAAFLFRGRYTEVQVDSEFEGSRTASVLALIKMGMLMK